jgi:YHS domain-containing protein
MVDMPITKRGVYHNLKESKYVVSNSDITFFFSSEHTLNKFMSGYQKYRDIFRQKTSIMNETNFNLDTTADIEFYRRTEKRGFYVWLKGVSMSTEDLYLYSIRMMTEKKSPEWLRIERKSPGERFK